MGTQVSAPLTGAGPGEQICKEPTHIAANREKDKSAPKEGMSQFWADFGGEGAGLVPSYLLLGAGGGRRGCCGTRVCTALRKPIQLQQPRPAVRPGLARCAPGAGPLFARGWPAVRPGLARCAPGAGLLCARGWPTLSDAGHLLLRSFAWKDSPELSGG